MKARVQQEALLSGIAAVSRVIPTSATLGVLESLYVEADNDSLLLAGTNLDQFITVRVGCKVDVKGAFTIQVRAFTDYVKVLSGVIELETVEDDTMLKIVCGDDEAQMYIGDAEEYPLLPKAEGTTVEIEPEVLADVISKTTFSAATDESRPVLTGVMIVIEGDELTAVAADGFRLSKMVVGGLELPEGLERVGVLVPAFALDEVARMLKNETEQVKVVISSEQIALEIAGTGLEDVSDITVFARPIGGKFVNSQQIIPTQHSISIVADRKAMIHACNKARIFSRYAAEVVYFRAVNEDGKHTLMLEAKGSDVGVNQTVLDIELEGEPPEVFALNTALLLQALKATVADKVRITGTEAAHAFMLTPVSDNERFQFVQMPMHVTPTPEERAAAKAEEADG